MIEAKVIGAKEATAELAAKGVRITNALQRRMQLVLLKLQSKIQGNLAAGIGLKSRHGTAGLAGSVRVINPEIEGDTVTGSVQGAGGPTWYGGMWERTGHGDIYPVTKKALSWIANGKRVFAMHVKAEPARPWMKPPFQEMKPEIISDLTETALQAGRNEEGAP